MTKEQIIETVKALPADFELEDLFERLIFIEKVEEGLRQSREGETVSHEEVERLVKSWQK